MYYLIATLKIDPANLPVIKEAVAACIEGTRKEAGNISYDLHESVSDPSTIVFVERWETKAALEAHFNEPHFLAWREIGSQYFLDRKIEIIKGDEVEIR